MASARWTVVASALLLGALFLASGAGEARAGQENYEFGKGLLKRRWYDLAEKVFRKLSESGDTQEMRNKGELGLIDVLKTRAENEDNPDEKKKLFDEAIAKYESFLQGKKDPQALFNLAELLKSKGTDFTTQIKLADDEEKKKELVKEAHAAFEKAVKLIKDFLDKINEKRKKGGMEALSPEEKEQLRNAMFSHADLHYLMAQVFEGSKEKKTEILKKADYLFEEFIWDFEDYGQAYLAYIQRGRCAVEMEEYGSALDMYNTVLLVPLPEDASPTQRMMRDRLRIMAYYRILEALVLAEKYEAAVKRAEEIEREYPDLIEDSFCDPYSGRAAVLEKAKALAGMGRISDAIQVTVRVVDKGGYYMQMGMKLLGDWVAQDPKAGVRIITLQAEGLFRTRKLRRAIEAYQNALDKIDTEEELFEFGTETWYDMATVYAARELYYEAALAFQEGERVAQVFLEGLPKSSQRTEEKKELWDKGAECAYKAYRAFKYAWEASRQGGGDDRYFKKLYSDQRTYLTDKYRDSIYAKNLQFFAGQDQLRQGKFLEAIMSFQSVEKESDFYETALVGIGQAYFKEYNRRREEVLKKAEERGEEKPAEMPAEVMADLEKAKQSFQDFLALAESKPVEGDEALNRRRVLYAYTYFFLGRVYTEQEKWEKVLEVLEGFEEEYRDNLDLVLTSVFLKLQAYYRLGDARRVEDMLRIMEDVEEQVRAASQDPGGKKHPYLINSYQLAGAIYGDLAAKAKAKHEIEAYREYNNKAAEYLWIWIESDILAEMDETNPAKIINRLDAVGIKLVNAGEHEKAALIYDTILSKLGDQLDEMQQIRFKRALGECWINLAEKEMKAKPDSKEAVHYWEKALNIFNPLYEERSTFLFVEKLVEIYTKLGDCFHEIGDAEKATLNYDNALKLYDKLLTQDKPEQTQWWEWKYAVWKILKKKGEYKKVVDMVTNAELLYPTLGGKTLKKKIKDLQESAKELAGRR